MWAFLYSVVGGAIGRAIFDEVQQLKGLSPYLMTYTSTKPFSFNYEIILCNILLLFGLDFSVV